MSSKIKNIIIAVVVAGVLAGAVYFFLIKEPPSDALLTSTTSSETEVPGSVDVDSSVDLSGEFISLLLSVTSIKLNDSIFSEKAFSLLKDSTIYIIPDNNGGRPNPFAPIGYELTANTITGGSNLQQMGDNGILTDTNTNTTGSRD